MTGYDIREVLPEVFRIPVPLEGNPLKELTVPGQQGDEAAQSAGGYRISDRRLQKSAP